METVNAGHIMSLAALQRQDPYINKLLDVTGQVALYNFNSKENEWEKTEIEGTLFVYARSASPHHGFTIMNRLSTENLVEPINKDLEFQLQDPFLLYRTGNLGIYSIWFYDKSDCQRIAQLMVKIVKQEAEHAKRGSPERAEPQRTNGLAEPRPIDILELLSKAKEEYQRTKTGEADMTAEHTVKPAEHVVHSAPQPEKSSHTIVKQITVEELFGSSLPKDPSLPMMPTHTAAAVPSDPSAAYHQNQPFPAPAHQNPMLPPHLAGHEAGPVQRHQGAGLLPVLYGLHPSPVPVFQAESAPPRPEPQPLCSVSPLMMPPAGPDGRSAPPGPGAPPTAPAVYMGQEILSSLKPSAAPTDVHKPVLAPSFLPSALFPPHKFQEPAGKPILPHGPETDVYSQQPGVMKPLSAVPMSPSLAVPRPEVSVLLSPSAFQQSLGKTPAVAAAAAAALPTAAVEPSSSVGAAEPNQGLCSKAHLQETLIHLLKTDSDFLGAIHEAYLQSLSKDFGNLKL